MKFRKQKFQNRILRIKTTRSLGNCCVQGLLHQLSRFRQGIDDSEESCVAARAELVAEMTRMVDAGSPITYTLHDYAKEEEWFEPEMSPLEAALLMLGELARDFEWLGEESHQAFANLHRVNVRVIQPSGVRLTGVSEGARETLNLWYNRNHYESVCNWEDAAERDTIKERKCKKKRALKRKAGEEDKTQPQAKK